jgi:hypothetical protein
MLLEIEERLTTACVEAVAKHPRGIQIYEGSAGACRITAPYSTITDTNVINNNLSVRSGSEVTL